MKHLTSEQRYTIERLISQRIKQKEIAIILEKHKSVISREISRNKDPKTGKYSAEFAQANYEKIQKGKNKKIRFTKEIQDRVEALIRKDYSPEQVYGECLKLGLACVSPERIYQHIWEDKKNGGTLYTHLRRNGRKYRKRGAAKDSRGILKNRVDIDQRPKIVEEKKRFGDLEIDTIVGKNHKGAIVTINDRASGFLWMQKIPNRTAKEVKRVTIAMLKEFKDHIKTITSDNGKEFALHQEIAKELDVEFYFAKPYHSWQRGANENLNGLIRQYIPKKSDFSTIKMEYIYHIRAKINDRPRKRFQYENPTFMMNKLLTEQKLH